MLVKEAIKAIQSKGSREFLSFLAEAYPVKEKTAKKYRELYDSKKPTKKQIPEEYILMMIIALAYPLFVGWVKLTLWLA